MRVYIAGPYSKGDVVLNVREAVRVGDRVLRMGHSPFIPHLTHLWHTISPKEYKEWLTIDLVWLEVCEAVLRIPGESSGADMEVDAALKLGIPVYYSVQELSNAGVRKDG